MIKQIQIKFFNKFKNPVFGSVLVNFPNFGGKKKNQEIQLCHAQLSIGF